MKKYINIFPIFILLFCTSCMDYFLDLEDPDSLTEETYFNKPEHFREAANYLYNRLPSYRSTDIGMDLLDYGTDLSTTPDEQASYGYGDVAVEVSDSHWTYANIRSANKIIELAKDYPGEQSDIAQEVAEAKFFRAFFHFKLMQYFGGIPIVTSVLETDSEELYAKRNSRYEVTKQILKDLDEAIVDLPLESVIPAELKGLVSSGAAQAFKARVCLHEATWMRYVGTTTDGDGVASGAGSAGYDAADIEKYLDQAIVACEAVMNDPAYSLWDYNAGLNNMSHYFLFNIEGATSNPLGLDKTSNKEFILYKKHDSNLDIHSGNPAQAGRAAPSRKLIDMILCADGLPIEKSGMFNGYASIGDEYVNRDYRMKSYFSSLSLYGDYTDLTTGIPSNSTVHLLGYADADAGSGYKCQKHERWGLGDNASLSDKGGCDFPIIRLAEVYISYAEAVYERYGTVTDQQLALSINKTRTRAGLPGLSSTFISTNGLDLRDEIRRERAVEFYAENNRFQDLRRWGIAEQELNADTYGMAVGGTDVIGAVGKDGKAIYNPDSYPNAAVALALPNGDTRDVILLEPAAERAFELKHYLRPIPSGQIVLNNNLQQNPGY